MAVRTYRLKITHEGREFEAEGDKRFVLEMLKRFSPQSTSIPAEAVSAVPPKGRERKASSATATGGKTLSLREFIQQAALKKHTDLVLAFGYYLEKFAGVSEFTPADINNCYYEAKLERSNTSVMIGQNIKRGFVMPSKKKGEKGKNRYTLTASGEKFVESKLPRS